MSKAFTKESEVDEQPLLLDELPPLPDGARNYVTPTGQQKLMGELERLRGLSPADARERVGVERRIRALVARLERTEVVDAAAQPAGEVRFGARVSIRTDDHEERVLRIVGVDEADAKRGLVSWLSPIAQALLGARLGDAVVVRLPRGREEVTIARIDYPKG
jgi:transcription elongation factor GreB